MIRSKKKKKRLTTDTVGNKLVLQFHSNTFYLMVLMIRADIHAAATYPSRESPAYQTYVLGVIGLLLNMQTLEGFIIKSVFG